MFFLINLLFKFGIASPFYSSYEKDHTKWTKTRHFKSCLVCSKPTLYSYTKIFIGQELTQTDGIDASRFIYFVSFRLWPRELHKNISSLRGFKASIFHLTSLSLFCSFPFSPFFFCSQCVLKHRLSRKSVVLKVCAIAKGYLNPNQKMCCLSALGTQSPGSGWKAILGSGRTSVNRSNVDITLVPVGGGMLGSQSTLH